MNDHHELQLSASPLRPPFLIPFPPPPSTTPTMGDPGCPTLSPYTEHPSANPSAIFPNHGYQVLSSTVSLLAIAIIAYVFGRRTAGDDLISLDGWRKLGVPRFLVTMVFLVSGAFVFTCAQFILDCGLLLPMC